jgi:hypothetical protein
LSKGCVFESIEEVDDGLMAELELQNPVGTVAPIITTSKRSSALGKLQSTRNTIVVVAKSNRRLLDAVQVDLEEHDSKDKEMY